MKKFTLVLVGAILSLSLSAQLFVNEGSNKNYSLVLDEDGEANDFIEIVNMGNTPIDLFGYSLSDNINTPGQYVFPHFVLDAHAYLLVFCDEKNRFASAPFTTVADEESYTPYQGWNNHIFETPFLWDGVSNLAVNVCSYSNTGYITNSIFNQTATAYNSTIYAFQDGSDAACSYNAGTAVMQRPNMKLNGITIGTGNIQNSNTSYPAPYGNWYWGARNQMLIRANELTAAGLSAGPINSLAFSVAGTDPVNYTYIEIKMNNTAVTDMSSVFLNMNGSRFHTNFNLASDGSTTVYLFDTNNTLVHALNVNSPAVNTSVGSSPDASLNVVSFATPTPETSNTTAPALGVLSAPYIDQNSGVYTSVINVSIYDTNTPAAVVHYTIDGSEPTEASPIYAGPITIYQSKVLRAKAFKANYIPSKTTTNSYLYNVNHLTPIISVAIANDDLYGPSGMFDNWWLDLLKSAHMDYFDSIPGHPLLFTRDAGMIMDGGAGGSRSNPQHSFRLEMGNGVLGDGPINYEIIPNRPYRNKYSDFYLRNGSNQYLALPYKDACLTDITCRGNNAYYSAWRPVSVYINGQYFGLYELREKFNTEMFKEIDNATKSTTEIMSLSYWYGGGLRAVDGNVENFWNSYNAFNALDPNTASYWNDADQYFDLKYYTDYIASESWVGNVDWPTNNIKIYRSDSTNYRWRFATIDLELSLNPNGWTDCYFDHINYMLGQGSGTPYINVWLKSIQNTTYKNYFINRFADLMNTSYRPERLLDVENNFFNRTVVEMQNEYQRWGDPWNIPQQMDDFYNRHLAFQSDLLCRTEQVRNHIQNDFALADQVDVTLDVYPAGAGTIHISTITPDTYPWTGVYFNGVPVEITATANPGWTFSNWDNNGLIANVTNPVFMNNITVDGINFTANFLPTVSVNELEVSNFNLYPNPTQSSLNIVGNFDGKSLRYNVYNAQGQLSLSGKLNSTGLTTLNTQDLASGLYILEISDGENGRNLKRSFLKD